MVARPKTDSPAENAYSGSSITVLEGLEAVRKRPGMYIGSTGERGLHHMVQEVVDNSVDEALAGYADKVHVTLLADGGVRVEDNGRGIPVDMHPVEKRPTVEVIMTVLHAGGKFDGKSYAVSGGLHGVGVTVVNALSKELDVRVWRDGTEWHQHYVLAKPGPLEKVGPTKKRGTQITFWADGDIFETTTYSFETISRRLQEMAFLNKGVTIVLRDERPGHGKAETGLADEISVASAAPAPGAEAEAFEPTEITYHYEGGLEDYVRHINAKKSPIHKSIVSFSAEGVGKNDMAMSLDVAMQWSDAYSESVYTFANVINTHEGGTHEEGFRAALTSIVNRYAVDKKLLKEKDEKLTGEDIREGLAAIVSVKLGDPQFEGQTKTKLGNTEVKGFVQKVANEQISHWFESNPAEAKTIITKASSAARARRAAQDARKLARKNLLSNNSLPGKLADCRSTDPRNSEVYIVEGDSAGGSAKSGRDSMFQAILPIRGKIINVEKARIDRVLKN
ncbi:MAG: ATP-binding protein, partial [Blastococcus sp.]